MQNNFNPGIIFMPVVSYLNETIKKTHQFLTEFRNKSMVLTIKFGKQHFEVYDTDGPV